MIQTIKSLGTPTTVKRTQIRKQDKHEKCAASPKNRVTNANNYMQRNILSKYNKETPETLKAKEFMK